MSSIGLYQRISLHHLYPTTHKPTNVRIPKYNKIQHIIRRCSRVFPAGYSYTWWRKGSGVPEPPGRPRKGTSTAPEAWNPSLQERGMGRGVRRPASGVQVTSTTSTSASQPGTWPGNPGTAGPHRVVYDDECFSCGLGSQYSSSEEWQTTRGLRTKGLRDTRSLVRVTREQ